MAFIGDALAHSILPGVAVAYLVQINLLMGALIAGIAMALGIGFLTRHSQIKEDTAIGVLFPGAFALGILLISTIRSYSVDLTHVLFGNVLGVSVFDLAIIAGLSLIVLTTIFLLYKELLLASFDPIMAVALHLPVDRLDYLLLVMLSLTIVVSIQTVGVALVVAMLVTPGATASLLARRLPTMMLLAAAIGAISGVTGLYLSFFLNVASGAAIVLVATAFFFLAWLFSPRKGLLRRNALLPRNE